MKKYIIASLCLVLIIFCIACRAKTKDVYFKDNKTVQVMGSINANGEYVLEPITYTLAEGVIDSNPGVYGERYTYVGPGNIHYSMALQPNANKTLFDASKLKKDGEKYEYYSANGELISTWGIDVSKYQGEINWNKVKAAGVEFVIIRLGYRGYGWAGKIVYDENFKKNI
ncbi:MAG: hypothetical protein IJY81_05270, partial [Lachnospiraceae bacterium]|nr:hypothetical protein [Lachnospiraceae bacterium]